MVELSLELVERLTSGRDPVAYLLPVGETGALAVYARDEEEWLRQVKVDEGATAAIKVT